MFNSTGNNFGAGTIQFKDYQAENYVVLNAKFSYDPTNAAYQGVDVLEICVPDLSINRSAVAGVILTFQDRYVYSSYTWNNDGGTAIKSWIKDKNTICLEKFTNFDDKGEITIFIQALYPMLNQVQMHPQCPQENMVAYCEKNHILPEAWSPLIQGQAFKRELLVETAAKYGVSVAQLCVRWLVQRGVVPVPKSATPARIRNNADVFGFSISDEDMERIASLRTYGMIGDPPSVPRTHQVVGF